ncbi:MAG: EAL domain-containing protein [Solirubrobacterales bacterium]|nr:EAL domain-containing protein [Solirubrobacterales bacterium]
MDVGEGPPAAAPPLGPSPQGPEEAIAAYEAEQLAAQWSTALRRTLADPRRVRVDYQPIVDLERGVVRGYEALARFTEAPSVPPRDWFAAATQLGFGGALESELAQAALVSRRLLNRKRFIAINVSRGALLSAEVAAVFSREGSLSGIVVEVPGDEQGVDRTQVIAALETLRQRGALVALDGLGGADLAGLAALRPEIVKLDAGRLSGLADGIADGELLDTCATVARKLGAWLVVKNVESEAMLDGLLRRGVPFAQGYALGRPQSALGEVPRELAAHIREGTAAHVESGSLAGLLERVPTVRPSRSEITAAFAGDPSLEYVLCVDTAGRPNGVVDRSGHDRGTPPRDVLLVPTGVALSEAVRRVIGRPLETRFDPLVCVDQRGVAEGIVPVDRLLGALVR